MRIGLQARASRGGAAAMVAAVLWAAVLAAGCAGMQSLPSPSAGINGIRVAWIGMDALGIEFDLAVTNPYPAALPLTALDYSMTSGTHTFLEGTAALDQRIAARTTTNVIIPVRMPYRALLEVGQEVTETHSLPYRASLGLHVATPVLGEIRLPLEKEAQLSIPRS